MGFDRWVRVWGRQGHGHKEGVYGSRIDYVPLQAVYLSRGAKVGVMGTNALTFFSLGLEKEDKI